MDQVAFALKFILKSCVELLILNNKSPDETFNCVNRPLKFLDYKASFQKIKSLIEQKIDTYKGNMCAMGRFVKTRWK